MGLNMSMLTTLVLSIVLFAVTSLVHASPSGSAAVTTLRDSSPPVVVTGSVSSFNAYFYRPVGVSAQTINFSRTNYAKSAICAAEFPLSRICTTEEMIYYPGRVSVGAAGASLMCSSNNEMSGLACSTNGVPSVMIFINNDFSNTVTKQLEKYPNIPVICCAP